MRDQKASVVKYVNAYDWRGETILSIRYPSREVAEKMADRHNKGRGISYIGVKEVVNGKVN